MRLKPGYADARRLAPRRADVRYNFAVLLQRLGRDDAAAKEYGEVLKLDPKHERARRTLESLRGRPR